MWNQINEWISRNHDVFWWVTASSGVLFIASLLLIPYLITQIRADYFSHPAPPPTNWWHRHPVTRWALRIGKNLCGALLFIAGIAMLFLPGQGILAMLMGLMLLDFPRKRHAELWLIRKPRIHATVNWIRAKTNHPPLEIPQEKASTEKTTTK